MIIETQVRKTLTLSPVDNRRLANLCGQYNHHIKQIEDTLTVTIHRHDHDFQVHGTQASTVEHAHAVLTKLYKQTETEEITPQTVHLALREVINQGDTTVQDTPKPTQTDVAIHAANGTIRARSPNQNVYLNNIIQHDINFGIGPAGTGKTYLAVACAVQALQTDQVQRIVLVRPAVEAGEQLGFLPGDMAQKVDPYLRPLYDALYEMLSVEKVTRLIERNIIEVAPLAYMRGRSLNDAFVILDEGQNTTCAQMKMFLTRIGFGSKAVITGDITQIDLPTHTPSGLKHASIVLHDVPGISFTQLKTQDIVRHPLVQRVVDAYVMHNKKEANKQKSKDD